MSLDSITPQRPLKIAVIGSGPSGFYTTEALYETNLELRVDMFERLAAPFGLVRYGVAPDHPKIRNVIKVYEKIASDPRFSFFGNVTVGKDISIAELSQFYDAIIFTCGTESDRKLNIPGENLPGSYTATEFVAWYNGHPDFADCSFDLSNEKAIVIGQGNVAMDVCRILAKNADELKNTDIAQHALDVLATSKIKEVHMIGRRGPVQAAFTPLELREFAELHHCDIIIDPRELELNPESEVELNDPHNAPRRKNMEILKQFLTLNNRGGDKKFFIHFFESPIEIHGSQRVEKITLERNRLTGPAGHQKATATGEREEISCGCIFRSVGYYGIPIEGLPFKEENGTIPNKAGRVYQGDKIMPGIYVAGWIKRGPSGIIGTNKPDAHETVKCLVEDLPNLLITKKPPQENFPQFLTAKGIRYITFSDWKKIDQAEIAAGEKVGKPREKFTTTPEMLKILGKSPSTP